VAKLRELAKKPSNKKCFDCGMVGIHSNVVLAPYNVFVCTTCAGLHRGLSHKVKTISMTSFTKEEIQAMETGGNKKAAATWLAKYDPEKEPIKPGDAAAAKDKIIKTFEKKLYYMEGGVKKKSKKKVEEKARDEDDEDDGEEDSVEDAHKSSLSKTSKKIAAPAPASVPAPVLDLLDFSSVPVTSNAGGGLFDPIAPPRKHSAPDDSDDGNPFRHDEPTPVSNPVSVPYQGAPASSKGPVPTATAPAPSASPSFKFISDPVGALTNVFKELLSSGHSLDQINTFCSEAMKKCGPAHRSAGDVFAAAEKQTAMGPFGASSGAPADDDEDAFPFRVPTKPESSLPPLTATAANTGHPSASGPMSGMPGGHGPMLGMSGVPASMTGMPGAPGQIPGVPGPMPGYYPWPYGPPPGSQSGAVPPGGMPPAGFYYPPPMGYPFAGPGAPGSMPPPSGTAAPDNPFQF